MQNTRKTLKTLTSEGGRGVSKKKGKVVSQNTGWETPIPVIDWKAPKPAKGEPESQKQAPPPIDSMGHLGRKDDGGKLRYDLVDSRALEELVRVLTYGAAKYSPNGWRHVPEPRERYYAALERHLSAWRQGAWLDLESGLPHLAHAACCLHFLLALGLEDLATLEMQAMLRDALGGKSPKGAPPKR